MSGPPLAQKADRETTTPFLLRLFYRSGAFHRLEEFHPPQSATSSSYLPRDQVQIYTWPTCSLRELTGLLTTALPSLLPTPAIGTRLTFRLVFPDTRTTPGSLPQAPRFSVKELGSVVVGADSPVEGNGVNGGESAAPSIGLNLEGEADKTLSDVRFVIGDYVCCAIFPPLADGGVAPAPSPSSTNWPSRGGYGSRGGGYRENTGSCSGSYRDDSFRGRGSGGRGSGYGRDFGGPPSGVPSGEWRRGERIPESAPGYSRGRGRGRW